MSGEFNWSLLDRHNLYSMLYSAGRDLVGKKMSIMEFQKIVSKQIKSHLPIKVLRKQYDTKQQRGVPYIGGVYDSQLDKRGHSRFIEIIISYHPSDRSIKLTEYRWARLCALFADTVLHEIIHMRQYRARNFKPIPGYESTAYSHKQRVDQEYYGDTDEMGAFSFNIACEMIGRFGYDPNTIKHYLDSNHVKRHKKSTYYRYLKTFDWDHEHPKMRQIKRKILKQLEYAYIGKPFKTTNFLTY